LSEHQNTCTLIALKCFFHVASDNNFLLPGGWLCFTAPAPNLTRLNPLKIMYPLMKFLHIAAAIAWLGGVGFVLFALRPVLTQQLAPPQRLPLISQVLSRFFNLVWLSIAALLLTGLYMLLGVGMKHAPVGWHLMLGIGLLMFALFGHLYFGPFRRLKLAVSASDWSEGGRRVGQIALLASVNLVLGTVAIAAVIFLV
jgi:uncharacterized membrane protein